MGKLARDMQAGHVRPWAHNVIAFVLLGLPYAVTLVVIVAMASAGIGDSSDLGSMAACLVVIIAVFVVSSRVSFRIGRRIYPSTRYRKR